MYPVHVSLWIKILLEMGGLKVENLTSPKVVMDILKRHGFEFSKESRPKFSNR